MTATIIFSHSQKNIWSVGKQYLSGFLKKQGNVQRMKKICVRRSKPYICEYVGRLQRRLEKKCTLRYLSVNVFSMKVLIWDTIFTIPTGDGTAILPGHPATRTSSYLQGKGNTFISSQLFYDPKCWSGPGNRCHDLPFCDQALYQLYELIMRGHEVFDINFLNLCGPLSVFFIKPWKRIIIFWLSFDSKL